MKLFSDLNVSGKRIFVRADIDVPVADLAGIENHPKLISLKPTFNFLLDKAKQIVIGGHIGRPNGKDDSLSTILILPALVKVLGRKLVFIEDLEGSSKEEVLLLENLRFWPEEELNDIDFAKKLAKWADLYVNEAFSVCHRNNASLVALPLLLPHAAGLHLEEEIKQLTKLIKNPQRPFVAIVGGCKIDTKMPVVENLANIADWVLVGGAIAQEIQSSKFKVQSSNVIMATSAAEDKDIDQKSIEKFKEVIQTAKTVIWNGPMGVFEEGFEKGTKEISQAIIQSGAYSVVGGGETAEFLSKNGLVSKFSFVSSGGGAMLAFLAGEELPGLKALE